MYKIATHNSVSGEKPKNLLSWLLTPWTRTQTLTIKRQLNWGVTMFDIRVKRVGNEWYCGHGPFTTKKTAYEILKEIDDYASNYNKDYYVEINYEGVLTKKNKIYFDILMSSVKTQYKHITFSSFHAKYVGNWSLMVDWCLIERNPEAPLYDYAYVGLNGKTWQTYLSWIPFAPRIWDWLYFRDVDFSESYYKMVDFY